MSNQSNIREMLVKCVLQALKADNPPWRSKHNRGMPVNPLTNHKFTGINPLVLDAVADDRGYRSKYWATYHQWQVLGIQVPKRPSNTPTSEYGVQVVNWQPFIKTIQHVEVDKFHMLETHLVFNADQCFGKTCGKYLILKEDTKVADYSQAEVLVNATKANIIERSNLIGPQYDRELDSILLPPRSYFIDDAQYWATKFHELVHWTESRLNWRGSPDQGELIAEIATGYLESDLDLCHDSDKANHNKWMPIWIDNIEKDPKYLLDSAAQAARVIDYIRSF